MSLDEFEQVYMSLDSLSHYLEANLSSVPSNIQLRNIGLLLINNSEGATQLRTHNNSKLKSLGFV